MGKKEKIDKKYLKLDTSEYESIYLEDVNISKLFQLNFDSSIEFIPFKKFIIFIKSGTEYKYGITVESNRNLIYLRQYENLKLEWMAKINKNMEVINFRGTQKFHDDIKKNKIRLEKSIKSVLKIAINSIFYIVEKMNQSKNITYKSLDSSREKKMNQSKKYYYNRNRITISDQKIVYIKPFNKLEKTNDIKRDYNIQTPEFNRRGHWRTYKKTGKKVWIESKTIKRDVENNNIEIKHKNYFIK